MTLRDLASIDRQLDAIDPDGSIAARGRACVARAPGDAAIDFVTADAGLNALAESSALVNGSSPTRVAPVASTPPTAEATPRASAPPPPLPSGARPSTAPPPLPTQAASHVAAMLAGAEMTFIPGAMPVPRLPFPGSSNSSSYETTEKETDESPWSKRAEAIPAAAAETRANDVGVDPNLDFDDLFEDFIPPAASAPISMAPPADELALDPLTEQARAEAVAATHGVAASELPQSATDSDIEELLDDDELEIVLDD